MEGINQLIAKLQQNDQNIAPALAAKYLARKQCIFSINYRTFRLKTWLKRYVLFLYLRLSVCEIIDQNLICLKDLICVFTSDRLQEISPRLVIKLINLA